MEGSSEGPTKKKQKKTDTKRKSLTGAQKTVICHLKLKGVSQIKLAEQFGVAEATISGIAHYKKIFCEDRIDSFDFYLESGNPSEELTIKDAIDFTAFAWKKVTS
ncbi:25490_t:CDS:2, partial [Gigaspora rosea]